MKIEDFTIQFDRNGVGGESSYICFFRATFDDIERMPMMATLWNIDESGLPTECMVHTMEDISAVATDYLGGATPTRVDMAAWRSTDRFLPQIRPLIREGLNVYFGCLTN